MQKQKTKIHNREGGRIFLGGFLVAIMTALFFMMLFAWIMTVKDLPATAVVIFAYAILISSSLLGGWSASRIAKEQGMKVGGIIGGSVFMLIFLLGVITKGFTGDINIITKAIVSILSGMIGGIIGVNRANKRKMK